MNDSAKEIDALDCKADPRHFARLFNYLVRKKADQLGTTPERLYELVAEAELRKAVRKAVDSFRPEARSITRYASWWLRQAISRKVRLPKKPFTLVQAASTEGGRSNPL